jgi:hypothetical protein
MRSGRAGISFAVAAAALAVMAAPALARKPDLVVTSASMGDPEAAYVFKGTEEQVSFKAHTKNTGHARAGRSTTRLFFAERKGAGGGSLGPKVSVPRLKPGEGDTGRASASGFLTALPYGRYYAIACADSGHDVAESNEDNNCHYTGRTVDVIADRFTGTVAGNVPIGYGPNVKESWSGDLRFTLVPARSGAGYYVYKAHGELTFKVSGSDGYCTYAGTGTHDVDPSDALYLEYSAEAYSGSGGNFAPFFYYTQTCPNPYGGTYTTKFHEGTEAAWWVTGNEELYLDVQPFKLLDSYDYQGVHWNWNLTPEG